MRRIGLLLLGALSIVGVVASCATIPEGVSAVRNFDSRKYLGLWYEIARFDFSFEKDLDNTTANYSLRSDGTIEVLNRGYDTKRGVWKQAIGKARFIGEPTVAQLEVSFFGPFYGGYNVIALDPEYRYALISGATKEYLWILSRESTIPASVRADYLRIAEGLGYDTSKLLWIDHDSK